MAAEPRPIATVAEADGGKGAIYNKRTVKGVCEVLGTAVGGAETEATDGVYREQR